MRLKELRLTNLMTQGEVATKNKITQNTYSNYEMGKTEPDIETLKRLADFYKVSVDYIIEHNVLGDLNLGYLSNDQKQAVKMLTKLNTMNFIRAYSYISGLYSTQDEREM